MIYNLVHNSHELIYRTPFGAVTTSSEIILKIILSEKIQNNVEIFLRYWEDEQEEKDLIGEKNQRLQDETIYVFKLIAPPRPSLLWYYFVIKVGEQILYYGNNELRLGGEGKIYDSPPPPYQITVYKAGIKVPNWWQQAVVYQIFVDRFYNGNRDGKVLNPKKNSLIHANWNDEPLYIKDREGKVIRWSFFGGNLLGVWQKLQYLHDLGITVIYFNPIFEAASNHKYDTGDYHKIDPMYGENQFFQFFCQEAKKYGIKVILDGVFSHTGSDSIYFNKNGNYQSLGAYQSPESPYYSWYRFWEYPNHYESWWGIETLPNVNEVEKSYLDFIIYNENSVMKYWQRMGIKGWRFDVADELPDQFIEEFRKEYKSLDPDAVLIGEVWEDASNKISYGKRRRFLLGEQFDSVLNYPWRNILLNFVFYIIDGEQARKELMSLFENYPKPYFYSLFNIIGSHDTPRILTLVKNFLKKSEVDGQVETKARQLLKMITLCQFTFPGVPVVFYGDEAGLEGSSDPDNRRTYPWGKEDKEILSWYKRLIKIRNDDDLFSLGEWEPIKITNGDILAFRRFYVDSNNFYLIVLNRSQNSATIKLPVVNYDKLTDLITNIDYFNEEYYTITPLTGTILKIAMK